MKRKWKWKESEKKRKEKKVKNVDENFEHCTLHLYIIHGQEFYITKKQKKKQFIPYIFTVNGNYTTWSAWTECDRTCGNGTKTRSRSCNSPPALGGGKTCLQQSMGSAEETAACFKAPCPQGSEISYIYIKRTYFSGIWRFSWVFVST